MTAADVPPPASPSGGSARAGVLVCLGVVLLGAPLGLLWAALAPPVRVEVQGQAQRLVDPASDDIFAVDGTYLVLALLAGVVCGVVAWRLVRPSTGAVVGLVAGSLLAAEVARRTGQLVDVEQVRAFVESGRDGVVAVPVRLRSQAARLAWPVGALAAQVAAALFTAERAAGRQAVSSG